MKLRTLVKSAALSDEFARLRRDLLAALPTPRTILVIGAAGGEGATTVALHLAVAICEQEISSRVLLAEGNVRSPFLAAALRHAPGPGLLNWDMESELPVRELTGIAGLSVLLAGTAADHEPQSSVEKRLEAACARAHEEYDFVVWDAPPLTRFSDGLTLASLCDGVLVVIEMDGSRLDGLRYVRSALDRSNARILGSVLNRTGRYWPRAAKHVMA